MNLASAVAMDRMLVKDAERTEQRTPLQLCIPVQHVAAELGGGHPRRLVVCISHVQVALGLKVLGEAARPLCLANEKQRSLLSASGIYEQRGSYALLALLASDYEEHMVTVLGTSIRKPLTKYHGAQIEQAFKRHDEVFAAGPLHLGWLHFSRTPKCVHWCRYWY
jgi:hypothetical protein